MLAYKLHQIGKSILGTHAEPDGPKPSGALLWLQKAFSIVDQFEDKAAGPSELKVKHQSLILLAYYEQFLSDNYPENNGYTPCTFLACIEFPS